VTSQQFVEFHQKMFSDCGNFHANKEVFVGLGLLRLPGVLRTENFKEWTSANLGAFTIEGVAHLLHKFGKKCTNTGMIFPQTTALYAVFKNYAIGAAMPVRPGNEAPAVFIPDLKAVETEDAGLALKMSCKSTKGYIEVCYMSGSSSTW
jgi:hypothetical protein